jgi:hypothetical protein
MTNWKIRMIVLAVLSGGTIFAQDITGTWQGTFVLLNKQELRTVFKVAKDGTGLKGQMFSIDQTPQPFACEVTLAGSTVKLAIPSIAGSSEGKLDSDGVNLTDNFTQGNAAPIPLNLKHLGPNDPAWPMPDAPARPKAMAADADPEFDACSIKPSNPGQQGRGLTGARSRDCQHEFAGAKQTVGGPAWMETESYDLDG